MEGKPRRVKIREVLPFDEAEGSDEPLEEAVASRRPPPPGAGGNRASGLPPPPSFGPPPAGPPKLPSRAKAAFEEAGPPPSRAPRRGRPRTRGSGKRQRARPLLAKTATGLESEDSSEEDASASASASQSRPSKQTAPAASQAEEESSGFFQTLWNGAAAAIGVVSDIVTAINAETDSEEEPQATSPKDGKRGEGKGKASEPDAKEKSSSKTSAEEEEQYVEYVSQFCVYLGVDVTAEPDLITEVDDYLRRPLPEGWSTHQTGDDCEYGSGYTYFMQAATGRTQWTRPDEDEFLQYLRSKMRKKPAAGSRLFFAALRDRNRRERWAALEDQIDHLTGARPLLRALPEGSPEPTPPARSESLEDPSIFHVVLHKRFPVMAPAVVEAFASYFGLGALTQFAAAELRHLWVAKLAALCPVPSGWEFKFDETSLAAVFVDQAANVASRHHPMDAFFAGLLERLLSRHRSVEAAESQRTSGPVALGSQMVFYLDSRTGSPYWLQYGGGQPFLGTLPWKDKKPSKVPPPRPSSAQLQPPTPDAGRAGAGLGLRDAAAVPQKFELSLRAAAKSGAGGLPPQPGPLTPQPPPTPPSLTPKMDDTARDAVGGGSIEGSEEGSEVAEAAEALSPPDPRPQASAAEAAVAQKPEGEEVPATEVQPAAAQTPEQPEEPLPEELPREQPPPEEPLQEEPPAEMPKWPDVQVQVETLQEASIEAEAEPAAQAFEEPELPAGTAAPEPSASSEAAPEPIPTPQPKLEEVSDAGGPGAAPPPPQVAAETTETDEVAEGASQARELPLLPSDEAEAGEKALAPHWTQRGGKWQTRGSRLSSDEEAEIEDDEEAQRRKIERAQRAADRRAKSGKLKDVVARFQSDEESQGPAAPQMSPRSATLFRLAGELQTAPGADTAALLGILQELERIPATVELLRRTQLGIITQPYKDHGDPEIRAIAKRLRRSWKDLIAAAAGEASAQQAAPPPPPAEREAAASSPILAKEPHHGMAPLSPTLQQEADALLEEIEEATVPAPRAGGGVTTAQVGGTDDADDVFGPTPRHADEHVGAPQHRPRAKAAPAVSAVADADEVFGTTPRKASGGYEPKDSPPPAAPAATSDAKKPKFGALPGVPGQAKAPAEMPAPAPPSAGAPMPPEAAPAPPSPVAVHEPTSAAPLPDTSAAGAQSSPAQVPAALKAALPRAPVPTSLPAKAPEPPVEASASAGYQDAAKGMPESLRAPLPKAPLPKAPLPQPPLPQTPAAAPAPPTPHDSPEEPPKTDAPSDSHKMEQRASAPLPPTPAPAPPTPTAAPEAVKAPKAKFAPLPAAPQPVAPTKPAAKEASDESSEDELIPATPQGPPEPQGMMPSAGYPAKPGPPKAPGPRVNAGIPAAARRQRMELVSNLQWLCRLFLETREQLFSAHEGTESQANCEGLREELDAVLFRRLLEETLTLPETAASPKSLIRFLRSFGRRALYGRRRSAYGRRAHQHFQQACGIKGGPRAFVLGAVPKILQLMSRLIDEGHASMDDAVEDGGDDPWLGSGTGGEDRMASSPRGLPNWEMLEGILTEPQDLRSLQDEADAFLAEAAKPLPAPLRLTEAERGPPSAEAPNSGSFAPRGRRGPQGAGKASADSAANLRRIPAQKPFYSTEPSLLLKVAKAPLPNLDQLVACLVPGAEITTEGLLLQLADDDLVIAAYALEQIAEAASKRLIKELEVRDELRSTCMHRREYLQLLDGALNQG